MSQVLDPTNTQDEKIYNQIRDTGHLSATNLEIDCSIAFLLAERDVIKAVPAMALSAGGRTYTDREEGLLALVTLTVVYMYEFGGQTAAGGSMSQSGTTTSGEVTSRSVTILGQTTREEFREGSTTRNITTNRHNEVTVQAQIDRLINEAVTILQDIGGTTDHIIIDQSAIPVFVGRTRSTLGGSRGIGSGTETMAQKLAAIAEGSLTYIK